MEDGLKYAHCALSFFRNRHHKKPLYRRTKRRNPQMVSCYRDNVHMARRYIRKAREAGFRGSVVGSTCTEVLVKTERDTRSLSASPVLPGGPSVTELQLATTTPLYRVTGRRYGHPRGARGSANAGRPHPTRRRSRCSENQ